MDASGFKLPLCLLALLILLPSCESELMRQQEEQIRLQQEEISRQRQELQELMAAKQKEEKKKQDCYRAFGNYEKAKTLRDPAEAVALYRQGLELCPEDAVAYYELGKILREAGRKGEAREAFEAALRINPNFSEAKQQLEAVR